VSTAPEPRQDRPSPYILGLWVALGGRLITGWAGLFLLVTRITWDTWSWTWLTVSLTGFATATALFIHILRTWELSDAEGNRLWKHWTAG
jgi:hypothetical protein